MVRLQSVVGRPLAIPTGIDASQLFLRLGYEDDNYGDNGYWGRDDGVDDQCKGLPNALVIVTIRRGGKAVPPPPPHDIDLVWDSVDDNFIARNPR
jgi:hypothetical protein